MTIGDRIKKCREDLNLTQTELAQSTKSSKQTIYKYENNIITNIPSDKIELLAFCLRTTPAYLMGWEQWDKEAKEFQIVFDEYEDKKNAFDHQLKILGWEYEQINNGLSPDDVDYDFYYLFKNGGKSFEVSSEEYDSFLEDSQHFFKKRIQHLWQKAFDEEPILNAAHARTDIEIPDGVDTSDDDIMDDENF